MPAHIAIQSELAGDRCDHQRGQDVHDDGRRHLGYHGQGEEVSQGEEVRRWVGDGTTMFSMIIMTIMMMMMMHIS